MTAIQKKALEYVLNILTSHDTHTVYNALGKEFDRFKIDKETQRDILETYQEKIKEKNSKIREAADWINSLLKDSTP